MAVRENVEIETGSAGSSQWSYQTGTSGNDRFYATAGNDSFVGGSGWDTVSYWYSTSAVQIYMNNVSANGVGAYGDTYSGIEVIDGSRFNDTLVGDAGANAFWGDAGNDYLSGGAGCDILGGGDGADAFHFSGALGQSNVDRVNDFSVAQGDTFELDGSVFKIGVTFAHLSINQLGFGSAATTAYQRIIYNKNTGELFYDEDGVGGVAQIKFADIAAGLDLKHGHFFIV
jgi:serralysin